MRAVASFIGTGGDSVERCEASDQLCLCASVERQRDRDDLKTPLKTPSETRGGRESFAEAGGADAAVDEQR